MAKRCCKVAKSTKRKCKNHAAGKSRFCASHKGSSSKKKKSSSKAGKKPRCKKKVGSRLCKNRAAGRGKYCGVHKSC